MLHYTRFIRRSTAALLCGLLGCLGVAYSAEIQTDKASEKVTAYYLAGIEQLHLGTFWQAAELFERAIKVDPSHAPSYYHLSEIARMTDQPQQAFAYARAAYLRDSTFRDYISHYARMLALMGESAEAERLFTRLLQLDRSDIEAQSMLAVIDAEQWRFREASDRIDSIERRAGIRSPLVEIKRAALIQQERYQEAYDYLTEVVEEFPNEAEYHIRLAELAAALDRDSIAMANYQTAIALDSTKVRPLLALAEYYRIKEQWPAFPEALVPAMAHSDWNTEGKIEYFNTYIQTYPEVYRRYFPAVLRVADALLRSDSDNPASHEFYSWYLIRSGQMDAAEEYLSSQIAEQTTSFSVYRIRIELAQYREQPDTADRYLALAREHFPNDREVALFALFLQVQRKGSSQIQLQTVDELLHRAPKDSLTAVLYTLQGDILYHQKRASKAFRSYQKALRIRPDDPLALNNYAYYLSLEQRNLPRALAMSVRSNELSPQVATFLDTQAWILYQMGQYAEAQAVMRQALVLDTTKSPEILLHYGDILYALGDNFMAKTYWNRALDAGVDSAEVKKRLEQLDP